MTRGEVLWLVLVLIFLPFLAVGLVAFIRMAVNSGHVVIGLIAAYLITIGVAIGLVYLGIWMRWLS